MGRRGGQLRALLRERDGVDLCLFDDPRARRDTASRCASTRTRSGTSICPKCARGSATAIASTARTTPAGPPLQSGQAPARPLRARPSHGPLRWSDALFGYRDRRSREDLAAGRHATARRACRSAWSSTRPSPGATTGRRGRPGTRRSSTRCTSRASPRATPTCPKPLRGTYAGLASPRRARLPARLGVTAVELLPIHQFVADKHLVERGLTQLLGLQLDRLLRPRRLRYAAARQAGRAGRASSRRW